MPDDIIESHEDVLQNLEQAVVRAYNEDRSLLDLDVLDAFDALIRRYASEDAGKTPPRLSLGAQASAVYAVIDSICEWQLGRAPFALDDGSNLFIPEPVRISELLDCLKRLRKSARFWNEQAGRQGYLDYISSFLTG